MKPVQAVVVPKVIEKSSVSKYLEELLSSSDDEDESLFVPLNPKSAGKPVEQTQLIDDAVSDPHIRHMSPVH